MSRHPSTLIAAILSIAAAALWGCNTAPATWEISAHFDSVSSPAACPTGICRTTTAASLSMSGTFTAIRADSTTAVLDGQHYTSFDGPFCLIQNHASASFCLQGWAVMATSQSGKITWQDRGGPGGSIYSGTYTTTK